MINVNHKLFFLFLVSLFFKLRSFFRLVIPTLSTLIFFLSTLYLSSCAYMEKTVAPRYFFIERKWVRDTVVGEPLSFFGYHRMKPFVTSDVIYQGNAVDGFVALKRKSGYFLWRLDIDNGVEGGVELVDGTLYFGGADGKFYAVDAKSGKIHWTFSTKFESLGQPLVHGDKVYFLSGNNTLYALNKKTGRQEWLYARSNVTGLTIRAGSRPMVYGDTLYVGFTDGAFVALGLQKGAVKWEKQLNTNKRFKDIDSFPVRDGNRIYVSSYDGHLFCLDLKSGNTIWKVEEGSHNPVTIRGDRLFYATSSRLVMALDKVSGKELWRIPIKKGVASQPSFFRGLLAFGVSQGEFRVVNASTGEEVGQYDVGRGVTGTPYLDEKTGEVYFISADANLFALRMGWRKVGDTWPWEKRL